MTCNVHGCIINRFYWPRNKFILRYQYQLKDCSARRKMVWTKKKHKGHLKKLKN